MFSHPQEVNAGGGSRQGPYTSDIAGQVRLSTSLARRCVVRMETSSCLLAIHITLLYIDVHSRTYILVMITMAIPRLVGDLRAMVLRIGNAAW
eukprot:COSAG06_NODE_2024_length_7816_cov_4.203577_3_plen_93_part_00